MAFLSLYTFTEGAVDPIATSSADQSGYSISVFGNLTNINVDSLSSSWTTGRAGLHLNGTGNQTRAISTYNTSTLVSLMSSSAAITFELWFIPANASQYGIIAGLGLWAAKSQEPGVCRSNSTTYNDFAIAQKGTSVAVNFLGGSAISPTCISSAAVTLSGPVPYHFIITINATTVTTYLNGVTAASFRAAINMSNWVSGMKFMFGQTLSPSPVTYSNITWAGNVFLAAIYNRTLSASEMLQNHAAGVPHSVPLPNPATLWIVMDVFSTFTTLPFLFYNNTDSSVYAPITLYISSKPSLGSLYTVADGNPDTRVGDQLNPLPFAFDGTDSFAYLPQGITGYTDSFQYHVSRQTRALIFNFFFIVLTHICVLDFPTGVQLFLRWPVRFSQRTCGSPSGSIWCWFYIIFTTANTFHPHLDGLRHQQLRYRRCADGLHYRASYFRRFVSNERRQHVGHADKRCAHNYHKLQLQCDIRQHCSSRCIQWSSRAVHRCVGVAATTDLQWDSHLVSCESVSHTQITSTTVPLLPSSCVLSALAVVFCQTL